MKNKKDERFPAILSARSAVKLRERFLFRVISRLSGVALAKTDVSRVIFIIFAMLSSVNGAEIYYTNRTWTAVEFGNQIRPADMLNAESKKLTNIVKGAAIQLDTTNTYAIERDAVALGHTSAAGAWNAAVNYNYERNHIGKTFDNVGWVRGTKLVHGEWGAYLWTMQNRIAFKSSATNIWVSSNGISVAISNVFVGSLGVYGPMSNVVDIGPDISPATNFPGEGQSSASTYYADITNVYYQLTIPNIWITPRSAVTRVGGSNVQYTVTGTNIPKGVTWSLIPDLSGSGGATIPFNGAWQAEVTPGNIATNYKVRATSKDNTNFYDQVDLKVTVLKVELNWEAMDSALDDNPNWNDGKRIFPDRQSPADTTVRDKVRLRAKLTPALPNIPLYFKAFDVDDPTPASIDPTGVIDANGQSGNDNRGSPQSGGLSATSGTTDNNGEVVVEFTVTKQPGDNFRVAVALNEAELNKLTITDPNSSFYVRPDNSMPGDFWGGVSPMLTVWRRLWLEFDSLETWPTTGGEKNFETGMITGIQSNMPAAGQSTLQLDMLLLDEENRYESGYIQIAGADQFTVKSNSDNWLFNDTVVIQGIPTQNIVGQTFTIYDDDNVQHLSSWPPRTMPYLLSGGSLINTAFADAYIKPESVPSTYIDNNVPFNRNMHASGPFYIDYYTDWLPTVDYGRDLEESEDFWYSYVLAAFQAEVLEDNDPDSSFKPFTLGLTDPVPDILSKNRSAIYVETIREFESMPIKPRIQEEHVVVHEIGHQGGGEHDDKGIMDKGAPTNENKFKDMTIKKFRDNTTF